MDSVRMGPRHDVDPASLVALPNADVAAITDFENHVLPSLTTPVAFRARALVAHDDSVTTAAWAADLVESGGEHGAAELLCQRHADGDEPAGLARKQAIPIDAKPGVAVGIVGPVRQSCHQAFAEQDSRRRRG